MANEGTQAASSPAEAQDPFNGLEPTHQEFSDWRETGKLAERFKPAEPAASAPADTPEKTADPAEDESPEHAPESDPEKAQEPPAKPISPAEKRIKQLLAEKKELERKLAAQAPTDVKPESSTAPAAPQQLPPGTRPKPKPDGMNQEGKPYETYEDYVEDLADWKAELSLAKFKHEQAEQQAQSVVRQKIEDARTRYEDADETIFPTAKAIHDAQIPQIVKAVIEDSDVYVDLCYVAGSDPDELAKFIALAQSNPRAAIGKVFEYERGIKEALAKNGNAETAPEKKRTQAPPPPTPVGGTSSRAFDVNDDSLSADEWFKKRNAQLEKRRA